MKRLQKALRDVKRREAGMQKSQCFQGFSARYEKRQQTMIGPSYPKVVGSNPSSATKSVTVVDTISTTVIFYLFPFWGCFWKETGDISNISSHKQIVCPDLMRPWSEKTGIGKIEIVIRI